VVNATSKMHKMAERNPAILVARISCRCSRNTYVTCSRDHAACCARKSADYTTSSPSIYSSAIHGSWGRYSCSTPCSSTAGITIREKSKTNSFLEDCLTSIWAMDNSKQLVLGMATQPSAESLLSSTTFLMLLQQRQLSTATPYSAVKIGTSSMRSYTEGSLIGKVPSSKPPKAWIAGVVLGILACFIMLAAFIFYWRRTHQSIREQDLEESEIPRDAEEPSEPAETTPEGAATRLSTEGSFTAISYNVTPPLGPIEEDEARYAANGVVVAHG